VTGSGSVTSSRATGCYGSFFISSGFVLQTNLRWRRLHGSGRVDGRPISSTALRWVRSGGEKLQSLLRFTGSIKNWKEQTMSKQLTTVELTALSKLIEKELKTRKDAGETVEPGNYSFDFTLHADGSLSRGVNTKVTPGFYMSSLLKALMLKYASQYKDPTAWLTALLSLEGALGAVLEHGTDKVLHSIPSELIAVWDQAEAAAKARFQQITPKDDRAGNTVVVGQIERQDVPVIPEFPSLVALRDAATKPGKKPAATAAKKKGK
jgi:hypothetical protein